MSLVPQLPCFQPLLSRQRPGGGQQPGDGGRLGAEGEAAKCLTCDVSGATTMVLLVQKRHRESAAGERDKHTGNATFHSARGEQTAVGSGCLAPEGG